MPLMKLNETAFGGQVKKAYAMFLVFTAKSEALVCLFKGK
jgi:hypothetical protein